MNQNDIERINEVLEGESSIREVSERLKSISEFLSEPFLDDQENQRAGERFRQEGAHHHGFIEPNTLHSNQIQYEVTQST